MLGELAGHAATFDPPPGSARPSGLACAIHAAPADAGTEPGGIGAVLADAAAVPEPDTAEAAAVAEVFGPYGVPVTAPKSFTGRPGAGAFALDLDSGAQFGRAARTGPKSRHDRSVAAGQGPGVGATGELRTRVDLATALLSVRDGVIPPTADVGRVPDAYRLDLVTGGPRPLGTGEVLVLARGRGGFHTAVVVRAVSRQTAHHPVPLPAPAPDSHPDEPKGD